MTCSGMRGEPFFYAVGGSVLLSMRCFAFACVWELEPDLCESGGISKNAAE